ncbi:Uncharacterized conserved protein YybS, DUF2232 family [Mesobacillus persicus]|uniref:Uncharacterized conserved protein YybS, DUF2232 family n=1 Tax=Mesobacillus persicus TaxID=930146 RepID=A0A1H8GFV4_9BACI|nr:YybS family protein [Mesobacillus persicus]SEN43041.1 Uncharacterized conserved protein YybS, DUF2232 family [Mesobacillus persicus]
MKNKSTYKLTEGAILLAIFTVLLLMTLYIPGLGLVVNFFLALPFMMFSAKHDWKSASVFTIAALILSLIVGTFLAIPIALTYGVTGVVIGLMIGKGKSRLAIFVAGSLVFLANTIIQYAIAVALFNMNMIEEFLVTFKESINTSVGMLENMGQTVDESVVEQFESTVTLMETLMPSMFVMASFMIVFLIQLLCFPVLRRFGVKVQQWMPFREMSLPKSLLWYYLLSLIASMFVQPEVGSYWHWAITNLLFVLQFLMLVQGFTFIAYYSHPKGYSKAILVVSIILAVLIPFILYIVRILGIIDLGFDLRKRMGEKK